jgi:hypothetical protein
VDHNRREEKERRDPELLYYYANSQCTPVRSDIPKYLPGRQGKAAYISALKADRTAADHSEGILTESLIGDCVHASARWPCNQQDPARAPLSLHVGFLDIYLGYSVNKLLLGSVGSQAATLRSLGGQSAMIGGCYFRIGIPLLQGQRFVVF